jgi:hypothetical protein
VHWSWNKTLDALRTGNFLTSKPPVYVGPKAAQCKSRVLGLWIHELMSALFVGALVPWVRNLDLGLGDVLDVQPDDALLTAVIHHIVADASDLAERVHVLDERMMHDIQLWGL